MEVASAADFDLATKMHGVWPAFGAENLLPKYKHMRELDMTNDSGVFRTEPPGLAVYEGRMVGQFDHRAKGYRSGKARSADWVDFAFGDPDKRIQSQFYVRESDLPDKLGQRPLTYRVGFCNIASPTNERTLVATLIPPGTVCGNKVPTITFDEGFDWFAAFWVGVANSFAMDFLARKKVSLTMTNTIVDSLPFPRLPSDDPRVRKIVPLVARLCCVGREMQAYWDLLAADGWVVPVDTAKNGLTDANQRSIAEAELNAIVALDLFACSRAELAFILDTFPIVEKRDRKAHGEYRTKRVILEIYDAMAEAARTGKAYQTRLDPPPTDPRVAHPARVVLPTMPNVIPQLPPADETALFIWALVYAAGGVVTHTDLARAFALRTRPALLTQLAPANLPQAGEWATTVNSRSVSQGILAATLRTLSERDGVTLGINSESQSTVSASQNTPTEDQLDPWFRFEARLTLLVLRAQPMTAFKAIDDSLAGDDRNLLEQARQAS
jgi:hypothetical protein